MCCGYLSTCSISCRSKMYFSYFSVFVLKFIILKKLSLKTQLIHSYLMVYFDLLSVTLQDVLRQRRRNILSFKPERSCLFHATMSIVWIEVPQTNRRNYSYNLAVLFSLTRKQFFVPLNSALMILLLCRKCGNISSQ